MTSHALSLCLVTQNRLDLSDRQVLETVGSSGWNHSRKDLEEVLKVSIDVVLCHHDKVEVVFDQTPHGSRDSCVLWAEMQHLNLVLLDQVLDHELRVGDLGAIIVSHPGTLALRSHELLEV